RLYYIMTLPPQTCPLFPYTTLFRSNISLARLRRRLFKSLKGIVCLHQPRAATTVVAGAKNLEFESFIGAHRNHDVNSLTCLDTRSEEHTSELQSRENLVCLLLLEYK